MRVKPISAAFLISLMLASAAVPPVANAGVTITPLPDGSGTSSTQPEASRVPTARDVQSLVDAGKYREALRQLLRLLDLHGPAATFDRARMLILRAECQLQIHEEAAALGSLGDAARAAAASGNTDDTENARAFAWLIQKSQHEAYTPVTGEDHKPLGILNRDTRKAPYRAAFADLFSDIEQGMNTASGGNSIMPLINVGRDFPALRGMERQGTGAATQSDAFAKEAPRTASRLILALLAKCNSKINTISAEASHVVFDTDPYGRRRRHPVGLTAEQVQTLDQIVETCSKVQQAVQELSKSFADTAGFPTLSTSAASTSQRAQAVRNRNYTHR